MPRTFPTPIEAARHLLASDEAWLLFVEVEVGEDLVEGAACAADHQDFAVVGGGDVEGWLVVFVGGALG